MKLGRPFLKAERVFKKKGHKPLQNFSNFWYNFFTPLPKTKKPLIERTPRKNIQYKKYNVGFYGG